MKEITKKAMLTGLLSSYAIPALAQVSSISAKPCADLPNLASKSAVVARYEASLANSKTFCAVLQKTDDPEMLELSVFARGPGEEFINEYGNDTGDNERILLIPNLAAGTKGDRRSYLGVTCNSSTGCESGETMMVTIEEKEQALTLYSGKYGKSDFSFLPNEVVSALELKKIN